MVGTAILVALIGWNLANEPPALAADGGWAAARRRTASCSARIDCMPSALQSIDVTAMPRLAR